MAATKTLALALSAARRAKYRDRPERELMPHAYADGGLVDDDDEDPTGPYEALTEEPHGDEIDNLFEPDDFDEAPARKEDHLESVHPLEKMLKRRRLMARGGLC